MNNSELINLLIKKGYKWIYMFKNSQDEFMVSKTTRKKNGDFRDDSNWDFYELEEGETYPYPKGVFVNLQNHL